MKLKSIKPLGQGGFGNVDLVIDENGRSYARKTFAQNQPLDKALLDNVLKRFAKEVRIQGGISHPNIVPILGSDLATFPPYYLMPVAEASLADDLDKDRTLGGNFIAAISDIVAGLEELHSMQIYHRDLKPQNVLRLQKDEKAGQFFYAVGDFGLISMKESQLSVLTKTGMRKSSDYYTAPEVSKDLKNASVRSDIYSLGCILHNMVGTEDRVPCGEINELGEFSAILLGCTRKDPAKRFKSARDVLDAILSVDFTAVTPSSAESIDFVASLSAPGSKSREFWENLAAFLETKATEADRSAIFSQLRVELIQSLCEIAPIEASRIGTMFAQWAGDSTFNFEYCDALANRLEEFFGKTNFEAKVECLMAMLAMGTSHNRWYVERKFARLCGSEMDGDLAKRLAVQFRISGDEICSQMGHLETSISFDRVALHPALVKALGDICK